MQGCWKGPFEDRVQGLVRTHQHTREQQVLHAVRVRLRVATLEGVLGLPRKVRAFAVCKQNGCQHAAIARLRKQVQYPGRQTDTQSPRNEAAFCHTRERGRESMAGAQSQAAVVL